MANHINVTTNANTIATTTTTTNATTTATATAAISQPSYRPDIDGLRALAVLAVLGFHAYPQWFPGGFIGVDIFFVISGYLIGTKLLEDIQYQRFNLAHFYAKRIRRIFPALLLVMAVTLGLGWLFLINSEYQQLGKITAGSAGFLSNFMLWHEAGYFDHSAETKPLLHLWSLAVEEQFYLMFPLLVWIAGVRHAIFLLLVGTLALISYFYNINHVLGDSAAAFYSPLSRFWELACGGLLAYVVLRRRVKQRRNLQAVVGPADYELPLGTIGAGNTFSTLQSGLGILLLALGFFIIDKTQIFPGHWALLPVVATMLVIGAGSCAVWNRRLLSTPLLVGIGKISYPLYLWHWPLLAFAQIQLSGPPSIQVRTAILVISAVLAWLTYIALETPIRYGRHLAFKAAALLFCMVGMGTIGWHVYRSAELSNRMVHNFAPYLDALTDFSRQADSSATAVDRRSEPTAKNSIAMQPDSSTTDQRRLQFQKNMRQDVQYVGKLFDEKSRAARYGICHMHDELHRADQFKRYLDTNSNCIAIAADKKNILLIGDSAAADMYVALSAAYPKVNFLQITGASCKPFLKAYHGEAPDCQKLTEYALNFAEHNKLDGVIVGSAWADDYALMRQELHRLRAAGQSLMLVGPPLKFNAEVAHIIQRLNPTDRLDTALDRAMDKADILLDDELLRFAAAERIPYLNWQQIFCDGGCQALSADGALLILDKFHLSVPGTQLLGARIKDRRLLESALQL